MPYQSPRNNPFPFQFQVKELVRVKAGFIFVEIRARTLCDGMPCYLTDNGEYWETELLSLRGEDYG